MEELHFEIKDTENSVRIEPKRWARETSDSDWDNNWVVSEFIMKGGSFSGTYEGVLMTLDFQAFRLQLDKLYEKLNGTAEFKDLEGYLRLSIEGDGIGHFEMDIIACDKPGIYGSELRFMIDFDQTQIKEMVNQLDAITKAFPVRGELK